VRPIALGGRIEAGTVIEMTDEQAERYIASGDVRLVGDEGSEEVVETTEETTTTDETVTTPEEGTTTEETAVVEAGADTTEGGSEVVETTEETTTDAPAAEEVSA